jgi:general secretion pathway protein G
MPPSPHATRCARRGFSLVELVIALAIVTLLAGVVVPVVSTQLERAKQARAKSDLSVLSGAFVQHRSDTGFWPANTNATTVATAGESLELFTCLYANTWSRGGWDGPYMNAGTVVSGSPLRLADAATDQGLVDPWGNAYHVFWFANGYSSSAGAIVFAGCGADGTLQTTAAQAFAGSAAGDDFVYVVTRKL